MKKIICLGILIYGQSLLADFNWKVKITINNNEKTYNLEEEKFIITSPGFEWDCHVSKLEKLDKISESRALVCTYKGAAVFSSVPCINHNFKKINFNSTNLFLLDSKGMELTLNLNCNPHKNSGKNQSGEVDKAN